MKTAPHPPITRSKLRQQLRRRRQNLTVSQQQQAAIGLEQNISRSGLLIRYRHIAFYLSNDGEIDPARLLLRAHRQGLRCYLPVLAPDKRLWFTRYRPGDPLRSNHLGILEPQNRQQLRRPWSLDLVLLPLVGFDRNGGRLGMGGGFYDRSFAGIYRNPKMRWPKLVGLAHSCQEVDNIVLESWDVPLSQVATDRELITVAIN